MCLLPTVFPNALKFASSHTCNIHRSVTLTCYKMLCLHSLNNKSKSHPSLLKLVIFLLSVLKLFGHQRSSQPVLYQHWISAEQKLKLAVAGEEQPHLSRCPSWHIRGYWSSDLQPVTKRNRILRVCSRFVTRRRTSELRLPYFFWKRLWVV